MTINIDIVRAAFPTAAVMERRGKVFLEEIIVDKMLDGFPLSFTRRRYPGMTYTWVAAFIDGRWIGLGDPWPCLMPPTKELRQAVQFHAAAIALERTEPCASVIN